MERDGRGGEALLYLTSCTGLEGLVGERPS